MKRIEKRLSIYVVVVCMITPFFLTGCASSHSRKPVLAPTPAGKDAAGVVKPVKPAKPAGEKRGFHLWGHGKRTASAPAQVAKDAAGGVKPGNPVAGENVKRGVCLRPGFIFNLTVLVGGKKEIEERSKRVTDEGMVILPLVGSIVVQDLTQEELQVLLTEQYSKYLIDPQISIDLVQDAGMDSSSPWGSVTVMGRVKKPGRVAIPATRDLTVSMAVQQAGSFDTSAKDTAIRVTRRLANGETVSLKVNLHAVGALGKVGEDIVLKPGDVVFVPELML